MPLQSSGQISLDDLHVEAGGTSGTQCSMNDSDIRGLIGLSSASQAAMNAFYGASNAQTLTVGPNRGGAYYIRRFIVTSGPNASTTNAFMYQIAGYGFSWYPSGDGSISSDVFMGQSNKKWTGFIYLNNPGGITIIIGSANNPHSTSSSNSGWNTFTISAYGTYSGTTKTWTSTLTRTTATGYSSDVNQNKAISGGTQGPFGYNDRWWWYQSNYGGSPISYSGDAPWKVIEASYSSANGGNGLTMTNT